MLSERTYLAGRAAGTQFDVATVAMRAAVTDVQVVALEALLDAQIQYQIALTEHLTAELMAAFPGMAPAIEQILDHAVDMIGDRPLPPSAPV